jgi:hypothetical protein
MWERSGLLKTQNVAVGMEEDRGFLALHFSVVYALKVTPPGVRLAIPMCAAGVESFRLPIPTTAASVVAGSNLSAAFRLAALASEHRGRAKSKAFRQVWMSPTKRPKILPRPPSGARRVEKWNAANTKPSPHSLNDQVFTDFFSRIHFFCKSSTRAVRPCFWDKSRHGSLKQKNFAAAPLDFAFSTVDFGSR